MKILIVDDDPKHRAFVSRGLTESGMICVTAEDGESALEQVRRQEFDLLLLDVMLPGIQGWDLMEALKASGGEAPVIWVTARDAVRDRVRGLRMGGEDYIVKPFAFAELLARIHVVMRSRRRPTVLRVGDLKLDLLYNEVSRGGAAVVLTPTEFSLLRVLAEARGAPVSQVEILQSVWGLDFDSGTNVLQVHIRRLRLKIDEPFEKPLIQTVRGLGYALRSEE